MSAAARAELRALLVRAATAEAKRQDAMQRDDAVAEAAFAAELRDLWQRHAELEAQAGRAA